MGSARDRPKDEATDVQDPITPAHEPPYVRIRNLDKVYQSRRGPVPALAGISLDIRDHEFLSIVGPSGCGKSTLLKCVAGLADISAGTIEIDGRNVVAGTPENLGMVFQRDVLLDWRTVIDNILLPVEFRRQRKSEWTDRGSKLLELFGLRGYERRFPWELSGGQRQRVAICRALLTDPRLLLMDEPFGALDALTRDELNFELQRIWLETRKTILFITHSITEAVFLGDRVIVMSHHPGRIEETITVDIPRPRRLSVRETPAFGAYTAEIRTTFERLGIMKKEN
ncbi:MAG: ABC transporter ATP-binding protein [Alphaproteobacteria bacterium]|nr:ABC transporter ATP-binding protein [Alphaproteobacteria bacterium]